MTSPFVPAMSGDTHVAVAVVDPDQASRSRLAMQLGQGATPFPSVADVAARLTGAPVVIVLGPNCAEGPELDNAADLMTRRREVGALVVAKELSMSIMQLALRAGIRDVLEAPVETGELTEAVGRVASTLAAAPAASTPSGFEVDGELGRVVTVFSTKGGAGKSVIATNLAVILAMRSDRPVVLIDADLQFGDIAVMLKLAPQHTIVDAVGALDRLDPSLLQNLLVTHQPSGLLVLPAPLEPAFADQIGAAEMVRIVEILRSFCSFVVIDTPAYFNDVVLGLIEESDDVLLVAGMDIPNIKNVKIGLQTLRLLNTPMEKLRLVLNRANSKVKLDVGEVERTLSVKADALIPSEVAVPQSVNKGMPVVLSDRKAAVSRSLEQLADLFLPVAQKGKRR
jgi:pilus assembly protein CpaE